VPHASGEVGGASGVAGCCGACRWRTPIIALGGAATIHHLCSIDFTRLTSLTCLVASTPSSLGLALVVCWVLFGCYELLVGTSVGFVLYVFNFKHCGPALLRNCRRPASPQSLVKRSAWLPLTLTLPTVRKLDLTFSTKGGVRVRVA
jgi:hypothetical protein